MFVSVMLKEKQFSISCGPATQPASWLAHVACLRYDATLGQHIGPPTALRRADGDTISDWTQPIHKCVADGERLIVVLRAQQHGGQGEQHDDEWEMVRPSKDEAGEDEEKEGQDDDEEEAEDEDGVQRGESTVDARLQSESSDEDEAAVR